MSKATSAPSEPVILDWTRAAIGPLAPCVCCGKPALCRSPVKDVPCHKRCAETWITQHTRDAGHLAQLIAAHTPDISSHLASYAPFDTDALVFTSPGGRPLRHSNFRGRTWLPALTATGLLGIHFHDLRHAGNLFMADAGANLRELMDRMGHSSSRAALIYLHSTSDRQRTLADAVADRARAELDAQSRGTSVAHPGTRPS